MTSSAAHHVDSTTSSKTQPIPSRRRDKPQLSCNLCRRRKLKCDRGQPCGTCAHRGLSLSCTYVKSNGAESRRESRPSGDSKLHDRIEQLEKLARSLANQQNTTNSCHIQSSVTLPDESTEEHSYGSPEETVSGKFGRINLNDPEAIYVEGTHWIAILDGISELKDYLNNGGEPEIASKKHWEPQQMAPPTLLSHLNYHPSKQELVEALPPKAAVDALMVKCFVHREVFHSFIHGPTFQKQYDKFWRQPRTTPIMWIAILYALMCMGLYYEHFESTASEPESSSAKLPPDAQRESEFYKRKIVECLVVGGYTKGMPYSIEALQLYMQIQFIGQPDSPTELWLLLGVVIRLAFRMGYHKDGSHFPELSPFEAEMRRRRWCSLVQMDTMTATQFGLPKIIDPALVDVTLPRNLFDEEFDESTTSLPEPRPTTTMTPILYLITKAKLFSVFGKVSEFVIRGENVSYSEVLDLDRMIDDAHDNIPPCFKMRSMTLSIIDSPEIIVQRVWIRLLHLKSKCILHRRYLRAGRTEKRWQYSRRTCIDAALEILVLQKLLRDECLPNGRLFQHRWRLASLIKQEYLLATAVLCVDVNTDLQLQLSPDQHQLVDEQSQRRVLPALQVAHSIWEEDSTNSTEAKKATKALQFVLDKARCMKDSHTVQQEIGAQLSNNLYSMNLPSPVRPAVPISNDENSFDWQSINPVTLLPEPQFDSNSYPTPFTVSFATHTTPQDFLPIDFQAQDLMDILQEDYPGMML